MYLKLGRSKLVKMVAARNLALNILHTNINLGALVEA